jgi:hypothetical protein
MAHGLLNITEGSEVGLWENGGRLIRKEKLDTMRQFLHVPLHLLQIKIVNWYLTLE